MGFTVGVPLLKLTNERSSKSSGKRTGILRSVACEALEERAGKDPDIDRTRTQNNVYQGIRSGRELAEKMTAEAQEYSEARKAAGGRALRSTAAIGFVAIVKPEQDAIMNMTPAQREKFFKDSNEVLDAILGVDNIRSRVRHKDKLGEHEHTFRMGFTKGGKLETDAFFKPQMMTRINKGYPEEMRKRGWDIEDCDCFDAAAAASDPEYLPKRRAKRKQNGKESSKYKAEKDAQRSAALDKKQAELEQVQEFQGQRALLHSQRARELSQREAAVKKREEQLSNREAAIKAQERDIRALKDRLGRMVEIYKTKAEAALKGLKQAETTHKEAATKAWMVCEVLANAADKRGYTEFAKFARQQMSENSDRSIAANDKSWKVKKEAKAVPRTLADMPEIEYDRGGPEGPSFC